MHKLFHHIFPKKAILVLRLFSKIDRVLPLHVINDCVKYEFDMRIGVAVKLQSHIHGSGADPGGSATDVVRHCPPWSVLIRHHPPSSQSHYGGYATFLLRTRNDLMLSDGGLAADWRRTSGNRSRKTTVTLRWLASLGGRTTANPPGSAANPPRGAALLPRSVVETSECRSTTAAGPCP